MPIIDLKSAYKGIEIGGLYLDSLEKDSNQLKSLEHSLDYTRIFDPHLIEESLNLLFGSFLNQKTLNVLDFAHPFQYTSSYEDYVEEVTLIDSQIADLILQYKAERNNWILHEVKKLLDKRKEALNYAFQKIRRCLKSFKIKIAFLWRNCWRISFRKIIRLLLKIISASSIDEDNASLVFKLKENNFRSTYQLNYSHYGNERNRIYSRKNR